MCASVCQICALMNAVAFIKFIYLDVVQIHQSVAKVDVADSTLSVEDRQ